MNNRRKFLKQCGIISSAAVCGGFSLFAQGCVSYRQLAFTKQNESIIIKKEMFILEQNGVVTIDMLPAPIYIGVNKDGHYTAVLMECTHKGCEVAPAGNLFICPCHGSEFSMEGKVLQSPAEKDLYKFSISQDEENIYISLN